MNPPIPSTSQQTPNPCSSPQWDGRCPDPTAAGLEGIVVMTWEAGTPTNLLTNYSKGYRRLQRCCHPSSKGATGPCKLETTWGLAGTVASGLWPTCPTLDPFTPHRKQARILVACRGPWRRRAMTASINISVWIWHWRPQSPKPQNVLIPKTLRPKHLQTLNPSRSACLRGPAAETGFPNVVVIAQIEDRGTGNKSWFPTLQILSA